MMTIPTYYFGVSVKSFIHGFQSNDQLTSDQSGAGSRRKTPERNSGLFDPTEKLEQSIATSNFKCSLLHPKGLDIGESLLGYLPMMIIVLIYEIYKLQVTSYKLQAVILN